MTIDVLGSGRVARHVARSLGPRVRLVTARALAGAVGPEALCGSRAPLVIATSIDEAGVRSRMAVLQPNLAHVLARLPSGALAGRLVIVVTNPVEPIVLALARLEPTARVVGFGLAVDRARFVEVLARAGVVAAVGVSGTHAAGALPVLGAPELSPARLVARLRRYRSPFARRALADDTLDSIATSIAMRAGSLTDAVERAARAIVETEHAGGRPPALRGAIALAEHLRRIACGS